jgi:hypothetical protein
LGSLQKARNQRRRKGRGLALEITELVNKIVSS